MSLAPSPESVTNLSITSKPLEDAVVAGTLAAGALVVEHLAFWERPWRLSRPASYGLGTATLGLVFTWWARRNRAEESALAWWIIAGLGGSAVVTAHWFRRSLSELDARALAAGRVAGTVAVRRSNNN